MKHLLKKVNQKISNKIINIRGDKSTHTPSTANVVMSVWLQLRKPTIIFARLNDYKVVLNTLQASALQGRGSGCHLVNLRV